MTILIPFAALVVLALFLVQRGVPASAAPLAAVSGTLLFFTLLGMFGGLRVAGWLYHLLALAALAWLLFSHLYKKRPLRGLSFGFWLWLGLCLLVIFVFAARQPMFTDWDEFSTWGTAAKLTKTYDVLYSGAPIGWNWPATQPPALANFAYAMQFWGQTFSEWQTYAAYNILQFAALAAVLLPFEKKHWNIALPMAAIALVTPFMLVLYGPPVSLAAPYLTTLTDIPLALLFGGALACYYGGAAAGSAATPTRKNMLPVCLALAALTLTKDLVGVALALVAAVIIFADLLLEKQAAPLGAARRAKRAFGWFGATAGAAVAAFLSWSVYLSLTQQVDRTDLGGGANMGMLEMPLTFLRQLFSSDKTAKFTEITSGMLTKFFTERITLLGSGAMVMALCLGLIALAALITKDKSLRRRGILFGILATLGFVAYYLFLTMYYLYIFTSEQTFASYERYVYPYYIGFLLVAALLLGMAARHSRFVVEGKLAVLALCAVLCLRYWQVVPASYSVVGFHTAEFNWRRELAAEVDGITARLTPGSRTFLISTDDDGIKYFRYTYEFLPYQMDYSFGGGEFVEREKLADGQVLKHPVSPEAWEAYLLAHGCTHVFIDHADEAFRAEYGHLFSDGMARYWQEEENIYVVQPSGDGVLLVPLIDAN